MPPSGRGTEHETEFCVLRRDDLPARLDLFLTADRGLACLELSRSQWQRLIGAGLVEVDGRRARSAQRLRGGETVRVRVPPPRAAEPEPQELPLDVVYEDGDMIVIDKPRGLVVHPAPGHRAGTLVNALLHHCPDLAGVGGVRRPGIVHRLDKDTSGLLVVAKNDVAHRALQGAIRRREVTRQYLALVYGVPVPAAGRIDAPIGRHPTRRKQMAVVPGGRAAATHYRVAEDLGRFALVEAALETGRTHQVRVHMAHIGHPLVGDPVYAGRRRAPGPIGGQALHAARLRLRHPRSGEPLDFEAPLPPDMARLLRGLRKRVGDGGAVD